MQRPQMLHPSHADQLHKLPMGERILLIMFPGLRVRGWQFQLAQPIRNLGGLHLQVHQQVRQRWHRRRENPLYVRASTQRSPQRQM